MSSVAFDSVYLAQNGDIVKHMRGGTQHTALRLIIVGLFCIAIIWVLISEFSRIRDGIIIVSKMPSQIIVISLALVTLTFILAAFSYMMLAFRSIRFSELLVVELAAAAINRVVPSGIGGLGLHGLYLHNRKHSTAQATAVVSINNLVGIVMHVLIFVALTIGTQATVAVRWKIPGFIYILGSILVVLLIISRSIRKRVKTFLRNLFISLGYYRKQPHRLAYAATALCSLTLINLFALFTVSESLGVRLGIPVLFIVYSVGVLFGSIVPTPGGLGGVEAGMIAGLIAYGVLNERAIAVVMAFRLATYWFPLVPGIFAVFVARRRHFV